MGVFCYCANPGATNTRIISGIFLCCEVKANPMLDKKPQPVAIIKFVACSFFLWFDLPSDWSCVHGCWIRKVKLNFLPPLHYPISNQSVHGFWFRTVKQKFFPPLHQPILQNTGYSPHIILIMLLTHQLCSLQ